METAGCLLDANALDMTGTLCPRPQEHKCLSFADTAKVIFMMRLAMEATAHKHLPPGQHGSYNKAAS
jgi:hypothetical protein